jgi:hypothetical protein
MLPSILDQFTVHSTSPISDVNMNQYANVGAGRIDSNTSGALGETSMKSVPIRTRRGPLFIHDKRWYFRLVSKKPGEYYRARALMDDYELNQLAQHLVICFMPDTIPGQTRPFRDLQGNPIRLYAFFESYLEFYQYMQQFAPEHRSFFEIIFGELPQKPHFDIDVSQDIVEKYYPGEHIDTISELLREAVMLGCIQVAADLHVTIVVERDLLLYSSHGTNKRSWHIVITNKCHDGNKEAKAFYEAVMVKVAKFTNNKYSNTPFVDAAVYSPRQQFRMIGSQKLGSGRPKIFYEEFILSGVKYKHVYNEDVSDPQMKKLTVIYESLVGFTAGCVYLPSLVPERPVNQHNFGNMPDVEQGVVDQCMKMLCEKVKDCPFTVRQVQGSLIMLARKAPSYCPICETRHDAENPYIIITYGRVYWDCRRSTGKTGKLLLGYLTMTIDELVTTGYNTVDNAVDEDSDEDGRDPMMFGDFKFNQPDGFIQSSEHTVVKPEPKIIEAPIPTINIPVEQRMQNVEDITKDIVRKAAMKKYVRSQAEDLAGTRDLSSAFAELDWSPGLK